MRRRFLLSLPLFLILSSASAQVPPPAFDLAPSLAKINDTADPQQAIAILKSLPTQALPSLFNSVENPELPQGTREIIRQTLPELHANARAARIAQDTKIDLEWITRTSLDTYKSHGPHDPAWDTLALNALAGDDGKSPEKSYLLFKAAIDAGCTDPMVRYLYIRRGLASHKITDAQAVPLYAAAAKDMDKSPYSSGRKLHIRTQLLRSLNTVSPISTADQALLTKTFLQSIDLLTSIDKENISPVALNEDALFLYTEGEKIGFSHQHNFSDIDPFLKKLFPQRASTFAFEAKYYIDWAWDARGSGFANTVTDDGWKLFNDRLKLAEDAVNKGYNIDPTNGECPAFMITICMGLSYDRSVMEQWFRRAMLADPDNFHACDAKFGFLMPKWGGSQEALLEFGRQCLANGTAKNRIPIFLLSAHEDIAASFTDSAAYLAQPQVWADIKQVYEKLLADKTRLQTDRINYLFDRAKYIRHACDSKQWAEALDLMNQYGNDIDLDAFGGQAMYNFYKKKAATELAKLPT